ncbi:hypothetical protein BpHYR1_018281 [Brachionus plicatilis]|uniref:Uncharacterized protein n=1 Tax=Brachionus plicatilis TaxID=10195 RepID=A0A3M7P9Y0_BRAPC|nr:hypothetical protein BpHYR1_018281 [Brachionus plicatilis]
MRQRMNRRRQKVAGNAVNAKTIEEISIPSELKITFNGEEFLLADSGLNDPERIIVLATK